MDMKQELLGTAFKKARSAKQKIAELNITPTMTDEQLEAVIMTAAQAKVDLLDDGSKLSDVVGGIEWYILMLKAKSALTDKELLKAEYDELNIENSSFDELASML